MLSSVRPGRLGDELGACSFASAIAWVLSFVAAKSLHSLLDTGRYWDKMKH